MILCSNFIRPWPLPLMRHLHGVRDGWVFCLLTGPFSHGVMGLASSGKGISHPILVSPPLARSAWLDLHSQPGGQMSALAVAGLGLQVWGQPAGCSSYGEQCASLYHLYPVFSCLRTCQTSVSETSIFSSP